MDSYDKYIGRILDNRYEILELIGGGGMANVYKALCHRLNRLVAIKILKEDLAGDEEFQRRFYTESQAIAMLSHPNIVAVYDVSRSSNTEYIVMELIEGITLKQYINRKGLLNWKETLHFTTQIVKALTHAHSRGIIHRDIKPHNIMILKDGSVKVADFGIARLLSMQNTLTQDALGSVHYISPEQAKGGHIDARSDIYSVGVVMYEMLTSRLPFVGDTAVSVAIQHISAIPLMPRDINPDIPIGLEEITMHAMEPDVTTRFTTAEEMLTDLEEFRKQPGIIFNYAISNPADRISADVQMPYETRHIPRDAIAVQNRSVLPVITARPRTDLTNDEYRDAKRRSRNTATLIGILSVVVVVMVLLAVFVFPVLSDWFNPPSEMILIPSFVDRKYDEVIIDVEYIGKFTFTPEYMSSTEKAEGIIISQDPPPNRERRKPLDGETINIRLIVSTGDEPPVEMPNLIGLHWVEARNQLVNLSRDLDVRTIPVEDDTKTENLVFETTPRYGELVSRGNIIEVKYAVPAAERTVLIPENLVGRTRSVVEQSIRDLDIIVDWSEDYDEVIAAGSIAFVQRAGE
ncbi:MAG: Stk1 family PASTA domain-containing Ser/Thr kinase, partial [Oscillospiraceae bacterium]|nr:Stk1 family PASTA domain-containing Ser/Thr kinase [Oscillospiraceae bacterium]